MWMQAPSAAAGRQELRLSMPMAPACEVPEARPCKTACCGKWCTGLNSHHYYTVACAHAHVLAGARTLWRGKTQTGQIYRHAHMQSYQYLRAIAQAWLPA